MVDRLIDLAETAPMSQVRAIASQKLKAIQARAARPALAGADAASLQLIAERHQALLRAAGRARAPPDDARHAARRADRRRGDELSGRLTGGLAEFDDGGTEKSGGPEESGGTEEEREVTEDDAEAPEQRAQGSAEAPAMNSSCP